MYFKEKGPLNTAATLELALAAAQERSIKHIVVASTSGATALLLADNSDFVRICVAHAYGFAENGANQMADDVRQTLEQKGVKVLAATHALSGVERGLSRQWGGIYPTEIIANTLRMFSQGVKVCVEIAIMALDSGLIPYGIDVLAIAGSSQGADTALVIQPAHANKAFETRIKEIVCKPR